MVIEDGCTINTVFKRSQIDIRKVQKTKTCLWRKKQHRRWVKNTIKVSHGQKHRILGHDSVIRRSSNKDKESNHISISITRRSRQGTPLNENKTIRVGKSPPKLTFKMSIFQREALAWGEITSGYEWLPPKKFRRSHISRKRLRITDRQMRRPSNRPLGKERDAGR